MAIDDIKLVRNVVPEIYLNKYNLSKFEEMNPYYQEIRREKVAACILNYFSKNNINDDDPRLKIIYDDKNFVDLNREKEFISILTLDKNKEIYEKTLD